MELTAEAARPRRRARRSPRTSAAATCTTDGVVPAEARCRAELAARGAGRRLRPRRRGARSSQRSTRRCASSRSSTEGARVERRAGAGRDARGPGARGAHRRADRAQPARPALRDRDAHRALRRRASRAPARRSSTRARRRPGLRALEKYAVRCGGGTNHRSGLDDAILVKENHLRIAGGIAAAVAALASQRHRRSRSRPRRSPRSREALERRRRPDPARQHEPSTRSRAAVELAAGRAPLEASGGITLENVRAYAETGVDFISVGALTHCGRSLDVSLEVE